MVEQKMDTNVYEHQIKQYYDEHKKEFVLNEPILQLIYVKISKDAPKISKLKNGISPQKKKIVCFWKNIVISLLNRLT